MEECFGDLTGHIHAVETGLSSDPPMNWRISALDSYQLISNSDAHSPAKLGREANLFEIPLSFSGFADAITTGNGLQGTIEFFPEEGNIITMDTGTASMLKALGNGTIWRQMSYLRQKITIGVQHRVEQLADRPEGFVKPNGKAFEAWFLCRR